MRKMSKKLISILLALCLSCSMVTIATTSVSAGIGTKIATAVAKKAIQLGIRGACKLSTELAAQADNDNASIVVGSVINLLILDGQGVTVNKISDMCEDILEELNKLEENVREYTSAISSAIDKQNTSDIKMLFSDKWKSDVSDVIAPSVDNAFDIYIKYLIASSLHTNGVPNADTYDSLKTYWKDHYHSELTENDYTEAALKQIKTDLEEAFIKIYDSTNGIKSKDKAYNSAYIFNVFSSTITNLVDNYMYDSTTDGKAYTVVECAATDAYYTLPFSSQQYEFVNSVARRQTMVVTLMQMALNEYLSMQGEYLQANYGDGWNTNVNLSYKNDSGDDSVTTYEQCKDNYQGLLESSLEQATYLLESDIDINTTAYTGKAEDLTLTLYDYMQPEDAAAVNLTINNYESSHDYMPEIKPTEADNSMTIEGAVKNSNYIASELKFYRVMSGGNHQDVYYILDTAQFSNSDALDIYNLKEHIKRYGPSGGSDKLYGDLYPVSVDYLNLIKSMSDTANNFSIPSAKEITDDFAALVKVPYFSAVSGFSLQDYLKNYLPSDVSGNTYILTSSYNNNYNKGGNTSVKNATIDCVNTNSVLDNTYTFATDSFDVGEALNNVDKYTVILSNDSDTYSQTATMSVLDKAGSVRNAYIEYGNGNIEQGKSGTVKSGDDITIKFRLSDSTTFDSLLMVRHNAQDTETVLIDSDDFNEYFEVDSDGYYTFDTKMPYSNVEFVLTTTTMDVDENGNFIIRTYDDLAEMSYWVNTGKDRYTNGNYILANDIDCKAENWTSIGANSIIFNGKFDGQGYTISNLNIDSGKPDGNREGLFYILGEKAVVKNLTISNANVWSSDTGSAVIAKQNNGTISKCMVTDSSVQLGNSEYLGGIAGLNNGIIDNCAVVNSNLTRRWGGSSSKTMGGITEVNNGTVSNCYTYNCGLNNGTSSNNPLVASGNKPVNCYYLDNSSSTNSSKTAKQFEDGEVAYLLNNSMTDGTQAWYQNIDNNLTANSYPLLVNNGKNTVYKVYLEDKNYSNYKPSELKSSELRTYQRIIDNGTLSKDSKIAYGYGIVDNANKVITVYMADTAQRMGILKHQGENGKSGILELQGDYKIYKDKTSADLINSNEETENIYTDKNGCIFIKNPTDGSAIPKLTVKYTQFSADLPTLYTLKVEIVPSDTFAAIGSTIGATLMGTLDKDDPDYGVLNDTTVNNDVLNNDEPSTSIPQDTSSTSDESSSSVNSTNNTVQTGDVINMLPFAGVMIAIIMFAFAFRRKKYE